jgi:hypothetical protein
MQLNEPGHNILFLHHCFPSKHESHNVSVRLYTKAPLQTKTNSVTEVPFFVVEVLKENDDGSCRLRIMDQAAFDFSFKAGPAFFISIQLTEGLKTQQFNAFATLCRLQSVHDDSVSLEQPWP